MYKVKESQMKNLTEIGFEVNSFYPNYVLETCSKKGTAIYVVVSKATREIELIASSVKEVPLGQGPLRHFVPELFDNDMLEEEK